jgi:hypothetical protein
VFAFRSRLWIVAAALAGHAMFDLVSWTPRDESRCPVWWSAVCLAYDLTAAIATVWLLRHRPGSAKELWQTGT